MLSVRAALPGRTASRSAMTGANRLKEATLGASPATTVKALEGKTGSRRSARAKRLQHARRAQRFDDTHREKSPNEARESDREKDIKACLGIDHVRNPLTYCSDPRRYRQTSPEINWVGAARSSSPRECCDRR